MRARGHVELNGPTWWLVQYQRDVDAATGEIRRRKRRTRLGSRRELRSKVAARAAADAWLARLRPEVLVPGPEIRAVDYFEHFLATHVPLYRPSSRRHYTHVVRHFLAPAFARLRLAEIDVAAIQRMIAQLAPTHARATVKTVRGMLFQVLRQALRDGYGACRIDRRDVPLPKQNRVAREARAIGDDELARILAASDYPWRALWAVLGLAGLRIGEALGLTWFHIDLERRLLRIRQACVARELAPPKTATSQADVPLLTPLATILAEYRGRWRANDAGLLFANRNGAPLDADDVRRHRLRPLLARLGLEPTGCHAFRHGLPARLSAAGLSPDAIQRFMRHSKLAMTERYLHLSQAEFARAIADADRRLAGAYRIVQPVPVYPTHPEIVQRNQKAADAAVPR